MSLFKKSFPPKDDAFYIKCKTETQRHLIINMLESNGFYTENNKFSFETHSNIQVHQSDIMTEERGKYFNVWSLQPNGINTGKKLKVYTAKSFL